MTEIEIVPDFARKTAKINGKVAAGEHVSVTLKGASSAKSDTLGLRIMFGSCTVAQFPAEDGDEWSVDGTNLSCTLNLNTDLAERMCRGPENCCLFVLEDTGDMDADVHPQLFFVKEHNVQGWPSRRPFDNPFVLDAYPSLFRKCLDVVQNMTASVTKTGRVATVTVNGGSPVSTTSVTITDGFSPKVSVANGSGFHDVTITDDEHQNNGVTFRVLDGHTPTWNELETPDDFPPSEHQHEMSDVTGLGAELDGFVKSVNDVQPTNGSVVLTGDDILFSENDEATVKGVIADHILSKNNPHSVTASQVMSNAQLAAVNSGITADKVAQIGSGAVASVNGKTGAVVLTGEDIKINSYAETAIADAIGNHETNYNNPHGVTAAQVGALTQTEADGLYVQTTDSRLTDARTPKAHKSTHATGGTDELTASDIGARPDTWIPSAHDVGAYTKLEADASFLSSGGGTVAGNISLNNVDTGVSVVTVGVVPNVCIRSGGEYGASIQKGGKEVATEEQVTAARGLAAYPIASVTDGALKDRTVNTSSGGTFTFPTRTGTNARDFVVSIEASATAPTVSFPATVSYVSDDSSVWTAEAGKTNVWYFSEVLEDVFMVAHKALDSVSQS